MIQPNSNIGYVIIETQTIINPEPAKIVKRDSSGKLIGEGNLQEANEKNRNGRYYDSRDLFPQVSAPRTLELLTTGNLRAENGHPLSRELIR